MVCAVVCCKKCYLQQRKFYKIGLCSIKRGHKVGFLENIWKLSLKWENELAAKCQFIKLFFSLPPTLRRKGTECLSPTHLINHVLKLQVMPEQIPTASPFRHSALSLHFPPYPQILDYVAKVCWG